MICPRCSQRHADNSVILEYCNECLADREMLNQLWLDIQECHACKLGKTVKHKVVGKGHWASSILFIGEAPGAKEDEMGQPFVGTAGKILDILIDSAELPEGSYYIANILKCRPPENRVPLSDEVAACFPFLDRAIKIIKPRVIVTLGLTATRHILENYKEGFQEKSMYNTRGQLEYLPDGTTVLPVYHPAAIIYNRNLMTIAKEDFKLLGQLYMGIPSTGS